MTMGAWRSSGDAYNMGDKTTSCIREATREVQEVLRGNFGGREGGLLVVEWRSSRLSGSKTIAYAKLVK